MRGITMVELTLVAIVVSVIAIASVFLYGRTVEKSRATEARVYLGTLRAAQVRYQATDPDRNGIRDYTNVLADLDIDLSVALDNWGSLTLSAPATTGFATLSRSAGSYAGQTVGITYGSGTVCGTFEPLQPLSACAAD